MANIYARAEEKYVMNTVYYINGTDSYLYKEETCENKVSKEELENAFVKGLIIGFVNGENGKRNYSVPGYYITEDGYAVVTMDDPDNGPAPLYSAEYVAE